MAQRPFKVTRAIPISGSIERPIYEVQSKVFMSHGYAHAKAQANDWQEQEKIRRWGKTSAFHG